MIFFSLFRWYRVDLPVNLTVIKSLGVTFTNGDKNNTDPRVIVPRVLVRRPFHFAHVFVRRWNETVFPAGKETQYYQIRRRRLTTEEPSQPSNDVETYGSEDFEQESLNYASNEVENEFDDGDLYADLDFDE